MKDVVKDTYDTRLVCILRSTYIYAQI